MGFRNRMKKNKTRSTLRRRHDEGTRPTGGSGRFPTIFNKEKVPEGVEFWRCSEGEHIADIIPFEAGPDMPLDERLQPITEEGHLDYVIDLFVHTNVGSMLKPYVCPFENFGKPCPICEFMKATKLEKEDWKKLVAKHRVVYFLWVHDSREEEKKGIQIFEASHFLMEEKIEEIAKLPKGGGFVNFSDPDTGKSLAWTRKGSGMTNTQYLGHRLIEREEPIPDRILDMTFPLDSIINMHPDYDEIEREFRGTLKKMNLLEGSDEEEKEPWEDDEKDDEKGFDDIDDSQWKSNSGELKRKRPVDRISKSNKTTKVKKKRIRKK